MCQQAKLNDQHQQMKINDQQLLIKSRRPIWKKLLVALLGRVLPYLILYSIFGSPDLSWLPAIISHRQSVLWVAYAVAAIFAAAHQVDYLRRAPGSVGQKRSWRTGANAWTALSIGTALFSVAPNSPSYAAKSGVVAWVAATEVALLLTNMLQGTIHKWIMHNGSDFFGLWHYHKVHHEQTEMNELCLHGHYFDVVDYLMSYILPPGTWLGLSVMLGLSIEPAMCAVTIFGTQTYLAHLPLSPRWVDVFFFTDPTVYYKHQAHHMYGIGHYNGPSYDLRF